MRIAKHVFVGHIAALLAALVALSLGIYNSETVYYVVSLWIGAFTLISAVFFLLRGYRRLVVRIGTANERLAEIKFLQERRYEQLRQRSDTLLTYSRNQKSYSITHRNAVNSIQQHDNHTLLLSELEDLNARLQRTERRILGTIAAEQINDDAHQRRIEELLAQAHSNAPGRG